MNRIKSLMLIYIILGVTFIAIVLVMLIPERTQMAADIKSKSATTANDNSDQGIINRVGRHIILPSDTPKVIPVTDVVKLKKEQPFFASAQEGDKLLVYKQKVILYSPTIDKIVEVATIK
jgi:hypothetical protein